MIERVLPITVLLFPASEVTLAVLKRGRGGSGRGKDRGSMAGVWLGVALGVVLAVAATRVGASAIRGPRAAVAWTALVLLVGGLALRWASILTLGKFFTVNVVIQDDHAVVDRGPYRFMRHPSYTGLLVAFLGVGCYFGNWLSLIVLMIPVVVSLIYRVRQEERALLGSLGPAYADYCARTKRFVPGLF